MTHRRRISGLLFVLLLASCASVPEQPGENETIATDAPALPLLEVERSSETLEIASPVDAVSGDSPEDIEPLRPAADSLPAVASRSAPLAVYTPENPLADALARPAGPEMAPAFAYDEPALPELPALAAAESGAAPETARDAAPETSLSVPTVVATETPREAQLLSPPGVAAPTPPADTPAAPSEPAAQQAAPASPPEPAPTPAQQTADAQPTPPESPQSQPAETDGQEIHERIDVQVAQSFTIELSGENWLFLPQNEAPVRLQSRDRIDGTTVFRFLPDSDAPFTLELQQQNLASGDVRVHRVEVSPVADITDPQDADARVAQTETGDDEPDEAEVDAEAPADAEDETEYRVLTSQEMLQTAREMRTQRRFEEAFELLGRWFDLYAGSPGGDLAHFLTGMILVESETLRNVRNGMSHLAVVRDEYPRSTLFREADAEYRRLQRHFVHVR
ncbi:MAG: hypothetical protein EA383_04055 [Spirochaetaceae bacterium]|nr:MAG: hypothetical protein EA383_04055 [Spirochaetaceae bacterium]